MNQFLAAALITFSWGGLLASAQLEPVFSYPNANPSGTGSAGAVTLGDVNGDGFSDFAFGETWTGTSYPPGSNSGSVTAYSGYDGTVLYQIAALTPEFGRYLSARNGFLAVAPRGNPYSTIVFLFNATTGAIVNSIIVPYASGQSSGTANPLIGQGVALLDDMDCDGIPELAFGNTAQDPLRIVSGATGAIIHSSLLPQSSFGSGFAADISFLRSIDDFDGDGADDIACAHRISGNHACSIYSTQNGMLLWQMATPFTDLAGFIDLGDIGGNGLRDFAIVPSTWSYSFPILVVEIGPGNQSTIFASLQPPVGSYFNISASDVVGDFDGDQVLDFCVAGYGGNSNTTQTMIVSGLTCTPIATMTRPQAPSGSSNDADWVAQGPNAANNGRTSLLIYQQSVGAKLMARPYPGSNEDITLRTGVSAAPTGTPIKLANPGQALVIDLSSPMGMNNFLPIIVAAQIFYSGFPVGSPLGFPYVHMRLGNVAFDPAIVFDGNQAPIGFGLLPPSGFALAATVPLGLSGLSVMLQGYTVSVASANGIFAATDAHEIRFL